MIKEVLFHTVRAGTHLLPTQSARHQRTPASLDTLTPPVGPGPMLVYALHTFTPPAFTARFPLIRAFSSFLREVSGVILFADSRLTCCSSLQFNAVKNVALSQQHHYHPRNHHRQYQNRPVANRCIPQPTNQPRYTCNHDTLVAITSTAY